MKAKRQPRLTPKRSTKRQQKPYWEMTVSELAAATKEFDQEFVPTKSLTPKMKRQWSLMKRKRGRPKVGAGAERVTTSIERTLLSRADAFAKARKMTRAQMIARGLELLIRKAG
jgi:hypothetical protein